MKLLVQGDDYGFTKGVTYGIIEAIDHGVLTSTGMFSNMEIAPWAAAFIKERPSFCFGIDFNLVAGPCVADPKDVRHLVDDKGRFLSSKLRVNDPLWKRKEGQETLFPYEEVYREMRAQYERFVSLTGRKPGYLNGHSIVTDSMLRAMRQISREEHLPLTFDYMGKFFTTMWDIKEDGEDDVSTTKIFNAQAQVDKSPLKKCQRHAKELLAQEYVLIAGHPGYVDAELFSLSSLSIERCRDLELVQSAWLKAFVQDNNVELISYADMFALFGEIVSSDN